MGVQLSIVVAVYNESPKNLDALLERLERILASLAMSYEVVFVNDGSKASVFQYLDQLAKRFPYVKLINFSRSSLV